METPEATVQYSRELGAVDTIYLFHAQGLMGSMLQLLNGHDPEIMLRAAYTMRLSLSQPVIDLVNEAITRGGKGEPLTLVQYRAALAALGIEDQLWELEGEGDEDPPITEGS